MSKNNVGDFFIKHVEIMKNQGIKEGYFDERVIAFMSIKLLIDNEKLNFNYKHDADLPFGLTDNTYLINKDDGSIDYRKTFINIIDNIGVFDNTSFFRKESEDNLEFENFNLKKFNVKSELEMINNEKVFDFKKMVMELTEERFLAALDVYNKFADFTDYPRDQYKNLYEDTITRMKKLTGSLTGQHFTQTCITELLTEVGLHEREHDKSDQFVIYDPTCGVGSMLYDSAFHAGKKIFNYEEDLDKHFFLLGQEMHGQTWFLAKIFSEISGFDNFIALGSTLTEPVLPLFLKEREIDLIIGNPPFGVSWKNEEQKIKTLVAEGINDPAKQSFLPIYEEKIKKVKGKEPIITKEPVIPKISDGQWLFFMHIAQALEDNPKAKAMVISGTSLASGGGDNSAEGKIRKEFIQKGYVQGIIEQPDSMFTNTSISTHIWVLNKKEEHINNVKILKVNNFINEQKANVLYGNARPLIEKQKHGYNEYNIAAIKRLFVEDNIFPLFTKQLNFDLKQDDYEETLDEEVLDENETLDDKEAEYEPEGSYSISFHNQFDIKDDLELIETLNMETIHRAESVLLSAYMSDNDNEINDKVNIITDFIKSDCKTGEVNAIDKEDLEIILDNLLIDLNDPYKYLHETYNDFTSDVSEALKKRHDNLINALDELEEHFKEQKLDNSLLLKL